MKNHIGICTWSLNDNLDDVRRVLDETGLKQIHLAVSAAQEFKEAIEENGWTVSCTMIGFPQEDYSTLETIRTTGGIMPAECWEHNRHLAMDAIDTTAELGVPFLSTHAGFIDHNDAAGFKTFCNRMYELADAAQEKGIVLLMETGQETAEDLRHFLDMVEHPALGVNFDPANMILYGKGDPIEAVKLLSPWIKHVHIKDAISSERSDEWGVEMPWGDGQVDATAFVRVLNEIDFTGSLAVEREAGDTRAEDIKLAVKRLGTME